MTHNIVHSFCVSDCRTARAQCEIPGPSTQPDPTGQRHWVNHCGFWGPHNPMSILPTRPPNGRTMRLALRKSVFLFPRPTRKEPRRRERDGPTHGSLTERTRAGKAQKRSYLDAPVPKEKPPPAPVPPGATVVEPSVLVAKENPVDMAAGAQRRKEAAGGSGRSSLLKAKGGQAASLLPSRDLAGTSSPRG